MLRRLPREYEIAHLPIGRRALRSDSPAGRVVVRRIRRLNKRAAAYEAQVEIRADSAFRLGSDTRVRRRRRRIASASSS